MRHLFAGVVISASLCVTAWPSWAQTEVERFERQLEQIRRETTEGPAADIPVGRRVLLDYGGYFLPSYLSLDDQQGDNHVLRQYDLIGYARLVLEGGHEVFARGRLSYFDFNDRDSFDGEGDDFEPTLERLYYRYDPGRAGLDAALGPADNVFFQGGRQLVYWGNGLVLSQTLDGAILGGSLGPADVQFLAGLTPKRTVDFDASRPDFDDDTHRAFYGAMVSAREGEHRPYAYFLWQDDQNHDQTLTAGPTVTRFGYDSYYVGVGQAGSIGDRLVYGVELVYEGGSGLSNSFTLDGGSLTPVDQVDEDVHAYAADVRLDYLFNDANRSRLSAELIYASGDDDRLITNNTLGGNAPGTRDEAFNAFGLLNTGLAFSPSVSNLYVLRMGAATVPFPEYRPLRNLQVGVDAFLFRKADGDAPIDEPTTDTAYLGWEPDVFLNWQIRSDVTLAVRYGIFFPNSDAVVEDSARQFIFAGLTFAF